MLIGRESHCARLDALLASARMGKSGVLAIRGEAGIGKTALLGYGIERAEGMTVVRAIGVESEAELEFSGLLDVCWPLRDGLENLAEHQAEVLRAALGLGPATAHDRFAVGAATLGLLGACAEANPVFVVVDDAQWLDRSSREALLFAARRLDADRVAVLFAARDGGDEESFEAHGIEAVSLSGLRQDEARRLLLATRHVDLAPEVAERLWTATQGNPLALIEISSLLSEEQLAGGAALGDPLPAGSSVERAFARRADALPERSRRALLLAAAASSSEVATVVAGLGALGLTADALEPAEDAGLLLLVDGRLVFRHPLVRSAVYHAATPSDRRAAHRALAEGLAGSSQAEARAWHLAGAALGSDDEAADALEHAAEHARQRGGYSAAATALQRAAQLSPDAETAVRRLCGAANAAWRAGRGDAAGRLVAEALTTVEDGRLRAEALRLKGAIDFFAGRSDAAAVALLEAVELLQSLDPSAAVTAAADAVNALVRLRQPDRALETARRARALAPVDGGETDLEATVALGFALCFADRYGDAEPHLRRAAALLDTSTAMPTPLQAGRLSAALGWLGRHEEAHAYLAEMVGRARAAGAVGTLPHLLASSAWQALHASRWNEAYADASEAFELAEECAQPVTAAQALGVLTWLHALRGDVERCRERGEETQRRAAEFGFTLYGMLVSLCFGLLDLSRGRVEQAIDQLDGVARRAEKRGIYVPGVSPQLELAEALIRSGRAGDAIALLGSFEDSKLASVPLFAAHAERCRGLLAPADGFESHFAAALGLHAKAQSPFALARTRLCYGERLRRAGRRVDAREQLRAALETFERLGAQPWAERARAELRASGATLRRRDPHEAEELTPQELQIALQVAEGKTNKEVGAALFLSHKTVEFHLSRIYRKLAIRTRAELIRSFAAEPLVASLR